MQIIRKTKSVCPKCIKKIKADIVEEDGKVYMLKRCQKHGKFKVLISNNAQYYLELEKLLLLCNKKKSNEDKKYYSLYLTSKCKLNCPICFVNANNVDYKLPSLEYIKNTMKTKRKCIINLFGGEPTLREDLLEVIRIIKNSKNEPLLYTNGLKISNYAYLKKLVDNGLREIHLQFDGFDDEVYKKLRGRNLIKIKKKALDNLDRLNVPTVLETTIAKGINEKEMTEILNYGLKNDYVKGIVFRSYGVLGKSSLKHDCRIVVDELLDAIEKQTKGLISKKEVYEFQKMLYLFSYIFSLKNFHCFYNKYFFLLKDKNNKKSFKKPFHFNVPQEIKFHKRSTKFYLFMHTISGLSKFDSSLFLTGFMILVRNYLGLPIKVLKSNIPKKILSLEFASMCDSYMFDFDKIKQCPGKPIIFGKNYSSFAMHNLSLSRKEK